MRPLNGRQFFGKGVLVLTIKPQEWISIYDANDGAAPPIRVYGAAKQKIQVAIEAAPHMRIVRSDIRGGRQGSKETMADRCHVPAK